MKLSVSLTKLFFEGIFFFCETVVVVVILFIFT